MGLSLRPMTRADLPAVAGLSAELGYPVEVEVLGARFDALAGRHEGALTVAHDGDAADGGAVLGWAHVVERRSLESAAHAELTALVVSSAARRRGVGRALVEAADAWAAGLALPLLRVRSNVTRVEAHAFYPSLGFVRVKTSALYERPTGAARTAPPVTAPRRR